MRLASYRIFTLVALAACSQPREASRSAVSQDREFTVPERPPDTVPAAIWNELHEPRNMESASPEWGTPFPRNLVLVTFREDASRGEKQQAIEAIGGEVVGGAPVGRGGIYYVRIKDDGTSRALFRAIDRLKTFRQVELVSPDLGEVTPLEPA